MLILTPSGWSGIVAVAVVVVEYHIHCPTNCGSKLCGKLVAATFATFSSIAITLHLLAMKCIYLCTLDHLFLFHIYACIVVHAFNLNICFDKDNNLRSFANLSLSYHTPTLASTWLYEYAYI